MRVEDPAMVKEAPTPQETEQPTKKGLPIKTIIVVLALLVVEAAALIGVMQLAGKPKQTEGAVLHKTGTEPLERVVEILVLKDKFPNNHSGRSWIWDVEIQVQVMARHESHVADRLTGRAAEIRAGVASIWRSGQHNYFNEPGLETLTRQVTDLLNNVFGLDPQGRPYVVRVLISRCVGFPTDY